MLSLLEPTYGIEPTVGVDPPHSHGEIRQWDPSLIDIWSESEGFFGKLTYKMVDGFSVALQSFVRGPEARHFNGSRVAGNDRMDAFVNTVNWSLVGGSIYNQFVKSGGKSLINIITTEPPLRLQLHTHFRSPLPGTSSGAVSGWHLNVNNLHIYFNPSNWSYFYTWWP